MADTAPTNETHAAYRSATAIIDADHPGVIAFARRVAGDARSEVEQAVRLFYAVRDEIRYDPYSANLTEEGLRASTTVARGRGFCVPKAIVLTAAARAIGIPARLGFADVRNHLATSRLIERMGTDLFVYHGYTEFRLEGRWIKATPTFNRELCEKFGVKPLEFDGRSDSLLHPFDSAGRRHMEYCRERGSFADVPVEEIRAAWLTHYPTFWKKGEQITGDFEREAAEENG